MTDKIAILGDTHFGEHQDSPTLLYHQKRFFEETFFPYLKYNRIKKVIHLGDVFHNRKKIDMNTARETREFFFEPLQALGVRMDVIAGNHDLYFREKSDTSALREIVDFYDNIEIFTEAGYGNFGFYIPWINKENRDRTMETIATAPAGIDAFGHLELSGFLWNKHLQATHGDDAGIFSEFNHVYSGHYHHRHSNGNITYCGSAGQYTWSDAGDLRGFHIYTPGKSPVVEFIVNPFDVYEVIQYTGKSKASDYNVSRMHVRVYHDEIEKASHFDKFLRELEEQGPAKLSTAPTKSSQSRGETKERSKKTGSIEVETTPQLIRSMVDDERVYAKLIELYNEANAQ